MADTCITFDEMWADLKRQYPETITKAERLAKKMEKEQMADLISRSALIEAIFKEWGGDPTYFIGDDNPITDRLAFAAGYAVSLLNNAPTVDAVEVVRCRDCKWYYDDTKYCDKWGDVFIYWSDHSPVPPDGYCFMGERREDATN